MVYRYFAPPLAHNLTEPVKNLVYSADFGTYQMQDGIDHLPVGHLANLDEADEDGELEIVGCCHSDDFVRPFDLTVRRTHDVRHFGARFVVQIIFVCFTVVL